MLPCPCRSSNTLASLSFSQSARNFPTAGTDSENCPFPGWARHICGTEWVQICEAMLSTSFHGTATPAHLSCTGRLSAGTRSFRRRPCRSSTLYGGFPHLPSSTWISSCTSLATLSVQSWKGCLISARNNTVFQSTSLQSSQIFDRPCRSSYRSRPLHLKRTDWNLNRELIAYLQSWSFSAICPHDFDFWIENYSISGVKRIKRRPGFSRSPYFCHVFGAINCDQTGNLLASIAACFWTRRMSSSSFFVVV